MDDSKIEIDSKPILSYTTCRPTTAFEGWIIRPLNWVVITVASIIISIPFFVVGSNIYYFWTFPATLSVVLFLPVMVGLVMFCAVRSQLRKNVAAKFNLKFETDYRRYLVLFSLPTIVMMMSATGITASLVFKIWQGDFDRVRQTIGSTIAPGKSISYNAGRIGIYPVTEIRKSNDGKSFCFYIGTSRSGLIWSETNVPANELFYPQEYTGKLSGGWYWVASDGSSGF